MLGKKVDNELQLLNFNDLEFQQDPVVSTVATREFSTHMARDLEYTSVLNPDTAVEYKTIDAPFGFTQSKSSRRIQIDIPSGNRYVDPARSYLAFRVTVDYPYVPETQVEDIDYVVTLNDNGISEAPKEQSALPKYQGELWTNLFSGARWIHSSKKEIDYVQRADHESYLFTSKQSSDWQHSIGSGYTRSKEPYDPQVFPDVGPPEDNSETVDVVVPLGVLFPSWRCGDKLLPPQLVGGSMFELDLNAPQNAFVIGFERITQVGSDRFYLDDPVAENILLGYFRFTITDARVVLDEREMFSSINSLMWNASVIAGTPLKVADSAIQMERKPFPTPQGITIQIPEGIGKASVVRNLSRLDEISTSLVLEPSGIVMDVFLPKLRAPLLGAALDELRLNEYRFKSGYRYWPNKEPTFSGTPDDGYIGKDSFLRWCTRHKSVGMTYQQWLLYINSYFMCFRRAQEDSTTGVAITHKRPMELTYAFQMSTNSMDRYVALKSGYSLRHEISSCRYTNVYGNSLESRD